MYTPTLADWIDILIFNPFGRFLVLMILMLCNFALSYLLCLAYLHRKGLPSLERPPFGDREAQGRLTRKVMFMRIKPDMGAALKASIVLTRVLGGALTLTVLAIAISGFTGH